MLTPFGNMRPQMVTFYLSLFSLLLLNSKPVLKGESKRYLGRSDSISVFVPKLITGLKEKSLPVEQCLKTDNREILFQKSQITYVYISRNEANEVKTSLSILQKDLKCVVGADLHISAKASSSQIIAGTIGKNSKIDDLIKSGKLDVTAIKNKWEAFLITDIEEKKGMHQLVIAGNDSHATAYGLLEISRMIGVSPWEWWADVTPEKKEIVLFPKKTVIQSPSVQFRGIFLNDEDWGLNPWSTYNFEPNAKTKVPVSGHFKGHIGRNTYAKIFELLLRLRANTIWPAMHEVTIPFYFVEGNKETADKYGIYIGSSHCEPLARNSATEWDIEGMGDYNYLNNKDNIQSYWETRLKELKHSNNIFTIGMRGKHDGAMQGVKTTEDYKNALEKVIPDQTTLLEKYIDHNVGNIPQIFIPYKELFDVYKAGLKFPNYVTTVWSDDNYGYITHFPDHAEQQRLGGNGIYYHISYWGRPHDYLWLGTANPALLYHQMNLAYKKNVRKIWIVNVGDIKPIEYQTELFLDMAWNIDLVNKEGLERHLFNWLENKFGKGVAQQLLPIMQEHYRLAYIRKPEFLGNTRTEEQDPQYKVIRDLPWSDEDIQKRLLQYDSLSIQVEQITKQIPATLKAAYFELVKYPIQACTQMNRKLLYAQLARHHKAEGKQSEKAYDSIAVLTKKYNTILGGKWSRMMDFQPRKLPVFNKVTSTPLADTIHYTNPIQVLDGADYTNRTGVPLTNPGLGYEGKSVTITKGNSISFSIKSIALDSVTVEIDLLPNHPIDSLLRFELVWNGVSFGTFSYNTQVRSEEWKMNVLRNQAIRKMRVPINNKILSNQLQIIALDEGVVVDQIKVYNQQPKKYVNQ